MPDQIVISRLHGGLGNQMFQYAAGRAIALRTGAELLLDLRYFDDDVPYGFGLPHFAPQFREARPDELPPSKRASPLRYGLWRALRLRPKLVREQGLGFNPHVPHQGPGCYLHGYWQSEKYFGDHSGRMRAELTVQTPPSPENARRLDEIGRTAAVSLHVRRGDYAADPGIAAAHGLMTAEYFRAAANHIAQQMAEPPVFYVFSDDPDWAEGNLDLGHETVVVRGNTSETSHEDLRLMSACRHHVIANSSFSWWGAWLNPSPDKIVVAPRNWFAHPKMVNPDICPEEWVRL